MTEFTEDGVKKAILEAGLEIYRAKGGRIQLAERIRLHLMDSGVEVHIDSGPMVLVTVRSQRSDFPSATPDDLFTKVRDHMTRAAGDRGFEEKDAATRDVTDPVDATHILDVWHELTYSKTVVTLDGLLDELQWALALPKCVNQ